MSAETKNAMPIEVNPKKSQDIMDSLTSTSLKDDASLDGSKKSAIFHSSVKLISVKTIGTNGVETEGMKSKNEDSIKVVESDVHASDIQKKQKRAERFGMNVKLNEKEKLFSRAERFGTAPTLSGSESVYKNAEDGKRKARAERFGIPAKTPAAAADEEAKKKARLSRFAQVSKTDSVEEGKREARAARFSITASSSLPEPNTKGVVERASAVGKSSGI